MTKHDPPVTALAPGPEFDLIRRFYAGDVETAARPDVRVAAGDDCAVVAGEGIALSSDMSVEDVHFRRDWLSDREIGFRAAAAALSDLAAMAARPIGVLVSIGIPAADAGDPAVEIIAGVRDAAASVGAVVLGGDVARAPSGLVIDVVAVGESPNPVRRSGARPGDALWLTGELGAAGGAVTLWLAGEVPPDAVRARFSRPTPRTAEALWLHERGLPQAMIDLSDGIAGDAAHLAAASGVALRLRLATVPIHPGIAAIATDPGTPLRLALAGGEDYELLFAARPGSVDPHVGRFRDRFGIPLTEVGNVVAGQGVVWENEGGITVPLDLAGFQHFPSP